MQAIRYSSLLGLHVDILGRIPRTGSRWAEVPLVGMPYFQKIQALDAVEDNEDDDVILPGGS